MESLKTARETWHPRTEEDRRLVLEHLQAILRESQFANSKRYPAFLRYVVERTLEGNAAQIKERMIGIEVFNRPNDYDTNNDTVVRYTAGEVRKRLALYHHEHDDSRIEISIPQGSYVPDFFYRAEALAFAPAPPEPELVVPPKAVSAALPEPVPQVISPSTPARAWLLPAAVAVSLLLAAAGVAGHGYKPETAMDRFWKPLVAHEGTPVLVPGASVFSPNLYSGVETAGKEDEYPFVSMQVAAAIARVSNLLQQHERTYVLQPANGANLSDLRDRPVVLLGGYNNRWTQRLLEDTRLHLGPAAAPSIVSRDHPQQVWQRDPSMPYASADDYAVIARMRDKTTGSLIVIIAGLGRNGTEGGVQYLTDPHNMAELEERVGHSLDTGNVEAVIKVKVVEGRTGAPSLEAVNTW